MTSAPALRAPSDLPNTELRGLASDAASVGALSVVARLAGALKTVAAAYYFRPGPALDAYLLAFLAPSFLGDVLAGGIGLALIPALTEARNTDAVDREEQIYAEALRRTVSLLGIVAVVAAAVAALLPSGIAAQWKAARPLLLTMLPMLPLMGITAVWRSVLHSRLHFRAAAIGPLLTPVTILILLPLTPRAGAMVLAAGTTLGMAAEACLLAGALSRHGIPRRPRWLGLPRLAASGTLRQYWALVAGSFMMRGSAAVDQSAAALLGAGELSLLNYGTRLSSVLLAIGPAAIGTTVMPRYSRAVAGGERARLGRTLTISLGCAFALAAVLVAVLVWGSEPLTRLVLLRGAFTVADIRRVSAVQVFSLLQLPFAVALAVLSGVIASLKANHSMLPLWGMALGLHVALDFYFFKPLGVRGIALATTVVQGFLVLTLTAFVLRTMRKPSR